MRTVLDALLERGEIAARDAMLAGDERLGTEAIGALPQRGPAGLVGTQAWVQYWAWLLA